MIPRSQIVAAEFYRHYTDLVREDDVRAAISANTRQFRKFLETIPRKKYDHRYADGKWTIREMLQHIIDCERVFAYRALRFSRLDPMPLASFEEKEWGDHAGGSHRRWKDLLEEFGLVREATEYLYASMSDQQLLFVGNAAGQPINAFSLGFIIPGHVAHHIGIIRERYL